MAQRRRTAQQGTTTDISSYDDSPKLPPGSLPDWTDRAPPGETEKQRQKRLGLHPMSNREVIAADDAFDRKHKIGRFSDASVANRAAKKATRAAKKALPDRTRWTHDVARDLGVEPDDAFNRKHKIGRLGKLAVVHINAGNDTNGNPRRAYLLIDPDRGLVAAVKEGYSGTQAIVEDLGQRAAHLRPSVLLTVVPATYAAALKVYGPGGAGRSV